MSVMVKNKTNKNYKRSQRGRSMVEMLGVLSIIGVLSVGGVYGYGVAMKKHKANELLHQASMLATTVSAQIDSLGGDLPETITDFGSTNYGKFSTSVTQTEDKKKFVLTIENMDSAVCTQMEKMTGGMVQGASCSGTTLTLSYYKNLATTEAEGEKSPTGGSSSSSFNPDGLIKGDGSTCSEALGECQVCIEGEVVDSNALCKGNQFCFSGTCQTVRGNSDCFCANSICGEYIDFPCETNADCTSYFGTSWDSEKQMCVGQCLKNSDCTNQKTGDGQDCGIDNCFCWIWNEEMIHNGACKTKDSFFEKSATIDGYDFIIGSGGVGNSWYSLSNFCSSYGKKMVSMDMLGCQRDTSVNCLSINNTLFEKITDEFPYHNILTNDKWAVTSDGYVSSPNHMAGSMLCY